MGNCASLSFVPNDKINGQSSRITLMCRELGFNEGDIDEMYIFFNSLHMNLSGVIPTTALSESLNLHNKEFSDLVMKLFNAGDDNHIDFENFIIACWNILTLDESTMGTFTFNLLDHKGYGKLLQDEIEQIVENILELSAGSKTIIIDLFLRLGDDETGAVDGSTFNKASAEFPCLSKPVRSMCQKLRYKLFSEKRTEELSRSRKELFGRSSLIGIISTLKNMPASYEYLIRKHGLDGSEEFIHRTDSGSILTPNVSENNPEVRPDSSGTPRDRERVTYFSPVFLMDSSSKEEIAILMKSNKSSRKNKKNKTNFLLIRAFRRQYRVISSVTKHSKLRGSKNRHFRVSPCNSSLVTTEKGIILTETIGSNSSKEEALRAMQEWSTAGKSNKTEKSLRSRSRSFHAREQREQRERGSLSITCKKNDPSVQRQIDVDKEVVQLIEANFWIPTEGFKHHEIEGHSARSNMSRRDSCTSARSNKSEHRGSTSERERSRTPDRRSYD